MVHKQRDENKVLRRGSKRERESQQEWTQGYE